MTTELEQGCRAEDFTSALLFMLNGMGSYCRLLGGRIIWSGIFLKGYSGFSL